MNFDYLLLRKCLKAVMDLKGIQEYTYKCELGFGCFSYVSLARNKRDKKLYAIKCFQLKKIIDCPPLYFYIPEYNTIITEAQFKEEVHLHTLLNHKNVGPKLYASWIENGLGYTVLEVWDRALECGNIISKVHISKIKAQIHQIHKCGYIHLDIKLDNILVKLNNDNLIIDVTLTDFGMIPMLIDTAQNNELYLDICRRLKLDHTKPRLVDMKLLERMEILLKIDKEKR